MTNTNTQTVLALTDSAPEPFLVPDVTPLGGSRAEVFHMLRDLVDAGRLTHSGDGYRRAGGVTGQGEKGFSGADRVGRSAGDA